MSSFIYTKAKKLFLDGSLDWDSGTFKAMLVTTAYTADPSHDYVSSAVAAELSGVGYVGGFGGSGRVTVTGAAVVESDGDNRAYLDCDDLVYNGINAGTIHAVILFKENTTDADSPMVAYLELTTDKTTVGGTITIVIPTNGWGYI